MGGHVTEEDFCRVDVIWSKVSETFWEYSKWAERLYHRRSTTGVWILSHTWGDISREKYSKASCCILKRLGGTYICMKEQDHLLREFKVSVVHKSNYEVYNLIPSTLLPSNYYKRFITLIEWTWKGPAQCVIHLLPFL